MIPLRTALLIDAPQRAVRGALRHPDVWRRTARALGARLDTASTAHRLYPGDVLRLRPDVAVPRWLGGPRAVILRVIDDAPTLARLGGPLADCRITVLTAATAAGTLTTVDMRVTARPAAATPLLRPAVLRFGRTLLGITALAADEIAQSAAGGGGATPVAEPAAETGGATPVAESAAETDGGPYSAADAAGSAAQVVVAAVVIQDGRVLLARRRDCGRWEFPGGKVEPGESEQRALARELAEELGVAADVGARVGPDVPLPSGALLRAYRASVPAGAPTPAVHSELRWAGASALDGVDLLPADRRLVPVVRGLLPARGASAPPPVGEGV